MTTTVKTCFKCHEAKSVAEFYKHSMMSDGHLNKCKECTRKDVIKNRIDRIEYYRSYDKLRASVPHRVAARKEYIQTAAGKKSRAKANDKWQQKHPERRQACLAVGNAIRGGTLTRLPCWVCGNPDSQGHHPDYNRPLDVMWLCDKHHKETHLLVKAA